MNRPSIINVKAVNPVNPGGKRKIFVGGLAVIVVEGTIFVPEA